MVHKIAVALSQRMAVYIGWQEKTALLTYGMEMFVGELFKFIILIALSIAFDMVIPMLLILAVAGPLRLTSGGGHLKTFTKCAIITILVFFLLALAANRIIPELNPGFIIFLIPLIYIVTLMSIHFWVPGSHPAKDLSSEIERLKFRRLSRLFVTGWGLSCLLLYWAKPESLSTFFVSSSMAIVWQDFLVSPLGYRFLDIIEALLTPKKKEVI